MSLINYVEPASMGDLFMGIGGLILTLVICWILFEICKPVIGLIKTVYNRETKYGLLEEKLLSDFAQEKGIDLDKEMIKKEIIETKVPSMRKKIERELFKKMFPEEKEDK